MLNYVISKLENKVQNKQFDLCSLLTRASYPIKYVVFRHDLQMMSNREKGRLIPFYAWGVAPFRMGGV